MSDAKYCISGDMANVMTDGASELEMGKNNNLPFWLARPKTAKKMSRMDTNIQNLIAFGVRRNAMQSRSDKHSSD